MLCVSEMLALNVYRIDIIIHVYGLLIQMVKIKRNCISFAFLVLRDVIPKLSFVLLRKFGIHTFVQATGNLQIFAFLPSRLD